MASVFKRTIRGRKSKVWWFKFQDYTGRWRTRKGGPSKEDTRQHALAVEADHAAVRRGEKPAPSHWSKGHLRPVDEVVKEYLAWGRERGGRRGHGWPERNARLRDGYLQWWAERLGWRVLGDIGRTAVEHEIDTLLTAGTHSPKSVALRVEAVKAFAAWATGRGLLPSNPLSGIGRIDTRAKKPHRPLTAEEIAALMEKAPAHRQVWYATALETGYRVGELRALTVRCLDTDAPCLNLDGAYTKDRKPARQFISVELCRDLAALAAGKPADASLLGIPKRNASTYFRADCDAADIKALTPEGKATWHSLRKSFVNAVVAAGADVKTSMTLARHSTADLTMNTYATADTGRVRAAADAAQARLRSAGKGVRGTHVVHGPETPDEAAGATSCAPEPCGVAAGTEAAGSNPVAPTSHTGDTPSPQAAQNAENSLISGASAAASGNTPSTLLGAENTPHDGGRGTHVVHAFQPVAASVTAALNIVVSDAPLGIEERRLVAEHLRHALDALDAAGGIA